MKEKQDRAILEMVEHKKIKSESIYTLIKTNKQEKKLLKQNPKAPS